MDKSESHINWTDDMLYERLTEVEELLEIPRDPVADRTKELTNERAFIEFEIAQRTGAVLLPRVVGLK